MMPGVLTSVSWDASVPFKASADRCHHISKQRHRVTNSAAYAAATSGPKHRRCNVHNGLTWNHVAQRPPSQPACTLALAGNL